MSHTLQPYSAYKESSVPWLGQVPGHWEVLPNRAVFEEIIDKNHPEQSLLSVTISKGVILQSALISDTSKKDSSNENKTSYKLVHKDDIVYNKMRAWQGALGVSAYTGIVSPAYIVMRLRNSENCSHYYHHLFRLPHFHKEAESFSYGITSDQWSLRAKDFKQIYTLVPPPEEQQAIVHFIQYMDSRINRYIRNKRRVIALLNEQKQAIIQRAVTCGLDPAAPLKPSGVEWLGDIPVGWDVKKIKEVSKVLRGRFSHRPRNDPSLYDGEYPFIQTGDIARAKKYISSYKQTLNEKGFAVSKSFPKGTLVMNIAANVGDIAVLDFDACFPDSVVGFFPKNDMDIHYYYYGLSSLKHKFLQDAPVNTQANLNVARIGSTVLAVPPIDEQKKIVAFLDQEFGKIEQAISRLHREIDLIREYRTRLIADVVTGKLDVHGVAVPDILPDEPLADPLADDAATTEPEEIEEAA